MFNRRKFLGMFAAALGVGAALPGSLSIATGSQPTPPTPPDTFKWSEQQDPTTFGKTYWVDPTLSPTGYPLGDDSNDGLSPQHPFQSFGRALDAVSKNEHDRIMLMRHELLSNV